MAMSEENKQKARERMKAMHAKKKAEAKAVQAPAPEVTKIAEPEEAESIEALKARIAELEANKAAQPATKEPIEVQVVRAYQTGRSSIQTIARVYGIGVDEVLTMIGEGELTEVTFTGDQIEEDEAGKDAGRVPMNYGDTRKVPFSTD